MNESIKNLTIKASNDIREKNNEIIAKYKSIFITEITKIVNDNIGSMNKKVLANIIKENFNNDIEDYFKVAINDVNKKLKINQDNLIYLLNNDRPKENCLKEYNRSIETLLSNTSLKIGLEDIMNTFIKKIILKIYSYFDNYGLTSNKYFPEAENMIRRDLKTYLKEALANLDKEHSELLKEVITDLNTKIIELINKKEEVIEPPKEEIKEIIPEELKDMPKILSDLKPIINLTSYEIIYKDDKYYLKNLDNEEVNEINFGEGTEKTISIKEDKVGFRTNDKLDTFADTTLDKVMIINKDNTLCIMCNTKKEYLIKLVKAKDKWIISYGNKEITDPALLATIIEKIAKDYPKYYEMISKDNYLNNLINDIKEYKQESSEIISNDNGKLEINPRNEESLTKKLSLFGYKPIMTREGLQVSDLSTENTYKLNKKGKVYYLEGIDEKLINFSLNYNLVSEDKISTGINKFIKNDITYYIDNDLNKIHYYKDKVIYKINYKKTGIICKKLENGKEKRIEEKEIIEVIKQDMPYLANYITKRNEEVKTISIPTRT